MDSLGTVQQLIKALGAGNYNVAPSQLLQGAALQIEDLSPVMQNVTFQDKALVIQQMVRVESCKSMLVQFDRQLSHGIFGGSAQIEGQVGQEETSDYVRIVVPMAFYSHVRRVTVQADMVATVDGKKATERAAESAAMKLAGDIELDICRGMADFSNNGVFDGNPLAMAKLANMHGLDVQLRQSDFQRNSQDLMFDEFGSDQSIVISVGGVLTQNSVEDSAVRSAMNHGSADKLLLDPVTLANYNKMAFNKERIILAGSPQGATGAELKQQWTSSGTITMKASRFLSGKTSPAGFRTNGPSAPTFTAASTTVAGVVSPFIAGQVYLYYATSGNEIGESPKSPIVSRTVTATGDVLDLTITPPGAGTVRYFNVYRTPAGGSAATAKFIGRVARGNAGTVVFRDIGNKLPGFVTGLLIEEDTFHLAELSPYSRKKLAVVDLSDPECFFRFCSLAVTQPRKNALLDNLA